MLTTTNLVDLLTECLFIVVKLKRFDLVCWSLGFAVVKTPDSIQQNNHRHSKVDFL